MQNSSKKEKSNPSEVIVRLRKDEVTDSKTIAKKSKKEGTSLFNKTINLGSRIKKDKTLTIESKLENPAPSKYSDIIFRNKTRYISSILFSQAT